MSPARCPPKPPVEMQGVLCYVDGMKLTFDKETGVAYLRVTKKRIASTTYFFRAVNLDLDEHDDIVGVEVFDRDTSIAQLQDLLENHKRPGSSAG